MKIVTETERFFLRELLPEDADALFELDADPEVHRYLGNNPVTEKKQVEKAISFIRKQYKDNGIGRWAIVDKKTGEFIGWGGLKFVTEPTHNHCNYYDLGYRLLRKHWGKGIGTEVAEASLHYAFGVLNTEAVYAMADCRNKASDNILKKVGMRFIETFTLDAIPHNWYCMDKAEFNRHKKFNAIL